MQCPWYKHAPTSPRTGHQQVNKHLAVAHTWNPHRRYLGKLFKKKNQYDAVGADFNPQKRVLLWINYSFYKNDVPCINTCCFYQDRLTHCLSLRPISQDLSNYFPQHRKKVCCGSESGSRSQPSVCALLGLLSTQSENKQITKGFTELQGFRLSLTHRLTSWPSRRQECYQPNCIKIQALHVL